MRTVEPQNHRIIGKIRDVVGAAYQTDKDSITSRRPDELRILWAELGGKAEQEHDHTQDYRVNSNYVNT